ncbi:MAG: hypothetical protein E7559_08015 [Ruminococcaceae bacterium]|nr:hypothetical protein [Oscillospiraceae bacterium]
MKKEIMVKVCTKCGIVNTERAKKCESCGAKLGAPVTSSEADKLCEQIAEHNEKMKKAIADEKFGGSVEDTVDIPVTPARIVIGVLGCIAAVCEVVLMILSHRFFPEGADEMNHGGFCVLLLFLIAVLHCFLPSQMWSLSHCMDWIHYKEIPRPSDLGLKLQVVSSAFLILLGVAFITLQVLLFCGVL